MPALERIDFACQCRGHHVGIFAFPKIGLAVRVSVVTLFEVEGSKCVICWDESCIVTRHAFALPCEYRERSQNHVLEGSLPWSCRVMFLDDPGGQWCSFSRFEGCFRAKGLVWNVRWLLYTETLVSGSVGQWYSLLRCRYLCERGYQAWVWQRMPSSRREKLLGQWRELICLTSGPWPIGCPLNTGKGTYRAQPPPQPFWLNSYAIPTCDWSYLSIRVFP